MTGDIVERTRTRFDVVPTIDRGTPRAERNTA